MARITFDDRAHIGMDIEFPVVVENTITDINMHFVRVYNDGKTLLSIIRLEICGAESFYTSVTNEETSPARSSEKYYGYLLRRNDDYDKKNHPDGQKMKIRIEKVLKNIALVDERLPKDYQRGGFNTQGHNGVRIFQSGMKGKMMKGGWYRHEGGNRFIHVANIADDVIGCEGLGLKIDKIKDFFGDTHYGVSDSSDALADFLDKILTAYENDIKVGGIKTRINIAIEDNIQADIKKYDIIDPKLYYRKLYKPRKKVKSIGTIKPEGPEGVKFDNDGI